jgi:hypothetical protein
MRTLELSLSFLVALFVVLALASPGSSQTAVPMLLNFQGELRSPSTGEPVPDGDYDVLFRIYDVPSVGAALWTGTHSTANGNAVAVSGGIFSVILGSGPGNALDALLLDGADRWLEIQVGSETLSPRQRMTSVAYSIVSENSRLLGGNEASDFVIQAQGLRLQPNATSPNLIAGHEDNAVTDGVAGATVGGGGSGSWPNSVTDNFGTVGGGEDNRAGDNAGTASSAPYATVGGGLHNIASGDYATVSGGRANTASGSYATVAGGYNSTASGSNATVGGGSNITASGDFATVAGGSGITASGWDAAVGGGRSNAASGDYATVAGGRSNQANASYATIAGGGPSDPDNPDTTRNLVTDNYGTIGGGGDNQAGDNAGTTSDTTYATVAGGCDNAASNSYATVAGGMNNAASGYQSTVSGGYSNIASGDGSAVSGGRSNTASGNSATVAGGYDNTAAGDYSFAAGRRARANHDGAFLWGDSKDADVISTAENQVTFRCQGGVRFWFGASGANLMVSWAPGNASWTFSSDRDLKENFVEIDPKEVLERVSRLPITEWNFKGYALRHLGPVAQDFQALFPLGGTETMIDSGDLQGVSLAAIQGLYESLREKNAEIAAIKNQNAELQQRLSALEKLFEKFSQER